MPLTDRQRILLFEIYEVPQVGVTEVLGTSGTGITDYPNYLATPETPLLARLLSAIRFIDQSPDRVGRVAEILEEYGNFALDTSPIDREGYSFRAGRALKAVRSALYPMVGIVWSDSGASGLTNRG